MGSPADDILITLAQVLEAAGLAREAAAAAASELMAAMLAMVPPEGPDSEWILSTTPVGGLDGLLLVKPLPPVIEDIVIDPVPFTQPIPALDPPAIDDTPPPPFNVPEPGFNIPDPPSVTWPIYDEIKPQLSDIQIPLPPDITLPPVPDISDIVIPPPPSYVIPDFEGELPIEDLTPPDPVFTWSEESYNSALKDRLSSHLYDQLVSGGTGLDEATEQAIYDRAESRLREKEEDLYDTALNYFAARGFTLPPGALSGRLLEIDNVVLQAREDLNNDVLVQQSNLAQKNTHFTIEQSRNWENTLIAFHNQIQQRAFDAAKYVLEAAIMVYQARVEAYKARLEAYKAQAQIYVARIQGEAIKAEFYKAQIAGVQAAVDVKKALVDAYTAQIGGLEALMKLYQTEMEGARTLAEIDKTKIDNFRALVQSYAARVEASTARYEGYKAQIQGETAKADMYRSRVQAYESHVQAYKAKADIDVARAMALVEYNKGEVAIYEAAIEKYRSDVERAVREAEALVKIGGLHVQVYDSAGKIYDAEIDGLASAFDTMIKEAIANIEAAVRQYDIGTRLSETQMEQSHETARTAARVAGQINAATISTSTTSTHHGWTVTDARSEVDQRVESDVEQRITNEHWLWQYIHTYEN